MGRKKTETPQVNVYTPGMDALSGELVQERMQQDRRIFALQLSEKVNGDVPNILKDAKRIEGYIQTGVDPGEG